MPGLREHRQQWVIVGGVTAAAAIAALLTVLLPLWRYLPALMDYPARRMPPPELFGWAYLAGLAAGVPLGFLVWKLPLPNRLHPVRDLVALLLATGMTTIPIVFILVPNALGGVLMAVPGLLVAVAVLYRVQRYRRIPLGYCLVAVVWGGTFAMTTGHQLLTVLHMGFAYSAYGPEIGLAGGPVVQISAPLWEEIVKGLGVLALFTYLRDRYDGPVHGFVLGAMVGAGFNFVETSRYAMYNFNAAMTQVWVRQWVSGITFGHVLFTGLIGVAIALAYRRRGTIARLGIIAGGLGSAIAAHFAWNWTSVNNRQPIGFEDATLATLFGYPLNYLILSGPFLLAVAAVLAVAARRERAELSAGLAAEVRAGQMAVTAAEAAVLAHPKSRRAHRLLCARALGLWAYAAVGHLQQLQLDLAHERFRLARQAGRVPPTTPHTLRRRIRTLRAWINTPMEAAP